MSKQEMGPHEEEPQSKSEAEPTVDGVTNLEVHEQSVEEFEGIYTRSGYSKEYLGKMLEAVNGDISEETEKIKRLANSVEHLKMQKQAMENILARE